MKIITNSGMYGEYRKYRIYHVELFNKCEGW